MRLVRLARLAEAERVNEIQRGKLDKLQTTRERVKQLSSRRDGEVAKRESQRSSRKSSVTSAQERAERDADGESGRGGECAGDENWVRVG